ncbi:MAG: cytochrome c [Bacillota bacterium]|nr:cytochrome c [Bacillota bacterium]HHU31008.1 cytochrome c [Bacillota bacterium]
MLKKGPSLLLVLLFAVVLLLAGCTGRETPEQKEEVRELSGEELVSTHCNQCHSLDRVTRQREDAEWQEHIKRMLEKSPEMLTEEEYERLLQYLQENF